VGERKMAEHFTVNITQGAFSYQRSQDTIDAEAVLDGLYVVRTSVPTL
jgi:hypothetical protein